MEGLATSTRPTKRQKTTVASRSPNIAFSSRILKTVKQAVYGKQANPKRDDVFGPDVTPRKTPAKNTLQKVLPVREDAATLDDESDELAEEDDGAMTATPTKARSEGWRSTTANYKNTGPTIVNGGEKKAPEETPTKKRKKQYKGWAYVDEVGDVGINNQDEFAKIAEEAAKGAAKATASAADAATVSAKSLRERKAPEPVKIKEERMESVKKAGEKRKREEERKSASKKGGSGGEGLGQRGGEVQMRDVYDDLPEDELGHEEVTEVRIKTMNKSQTTPRKAKDKGSNMESKAAQAFKGHRDPSEDDSAPFYGPRTIASSKKTTRHSSAKVSEDSPFVTAADDELPIALPKARSTKELLTAASRLESLLSQHTSALASIKQPILAQVTGRQLLPNLPHVSDEYQKVHQLLSQTVLAGEGNSMLVIGSRGSGKTAVVERAISDLTESNKDDFYVVRLNGFIHTDDKLALREIWRQLGKELEGEDEDRALRSNYADTLTSLLALLSHQDENQEEDGEQTSTAKSVIFVLDEFDLFAQHPRQTLLYNLFDVAQSHRNAPVAVLGLTTKVNVVDSLEKRVKSRFGQRYVHISLPKSFESFKDICLEALTYRSSSPSTSSTFIARLHHHQTSGDSLPDEVSKAWNAYTSALLASTPLSAHLHSAHSTTNRPTSFLSAIALPLLLALTPSTLSSPVFTPLSQPDSPLTLLPALNTLQLSLLIAAARLDIILSTDICSFDMCYEEYVALASRSKLQSSASGQLAQGGGARIWGREVARGAWEGLARVGLCVPATGGGGRGGGELWRCDVGLEEIRAWLEGEGKGAGGTGGLAKWCREI